MTVSTRRTWIERIVLAIGVVILFVMPHSVRGDGQPRFDGLARLMDHGTFSATRYSMVGPLFAAPLYLFGKILGSPAEACGYFNVTLLTLALFLFRRELAHVVDAAKTRLFLILVVYASMFPSHIQFFYGEVFTALAVTLGLFFLSRGAARSGWAAILLGTVNTPASILGVAFVAASFAWREKRWRYLLIPIAAYLLIRFECLAFRGSFFATGYEGDKGFHTDLPYSGRPGFSYPFFFGILSILLSFGKGIFFFAPGIVLGWKNEPAGIKRVHQSLVLFLAGLVIVYARWWSWQGGWFWGPRFFLIASIPACLAIAFHVRDAEEHSLADNIVTLIALTFSMWVGVNGLIFDTTGLNLCERNDYQLESLCLYVPELSVLWHPFVDFASTVPAKTRGLALGVCAFWAIVYITLAKDLLRLVIARTIDRVRSPLAQIRDFKF